MLKHTHTHTHPHTHPHTHTLTQTQAHAHAHTHTNTHTQTHTHTGYSLGGVFTPHFLQLIPPVRDTPLQINIDALFVRVLVTHTQTAGLQPLEIHAEPVSYPEFTWRVGARQLSCQA